MACRCGANTPGRRKAKTLCYTCVATGKARLIEPGFFCLPPKYPFGDKLTKPVIFIRLPGPVQTPGAGGFPAATPLPPVLAGGRTPENFSRRPYSCKKTAVSKNYETEKLPNTAAGDTGKRVRKGAGTQMSVKYKYHFMSIYKFVKNLLSG
jgi:hypothetical protein